MSTRAQIGFYETSDAKIESAEVFVYRHSDGAPERVLKELLPFAKWFDKVRGLEDTVYATARCLQYMANKQDEHLKKFHKSRGITNIGEGFAICYGVDTQIHGDIEYFYHVSPGKIQVFEPKERGWHWIQSVMFKTRKAEAL